MAYGKNRQHNCYEDKLINQIDTERFMEKIAADLREAIWDAGNGGKGLKAKLADHRLMYIAIKMTEAIETRNLIEIEHWGKKVEEYCMPKVKEVKQDFGAGADMLMETVARALSGVRQDRIEE